MPIPVDPLSAPPAASSPFVSLRRVVALSAVAGYVEVVGFVDLGGVYYPGIMTGNTVQLGLALAQGRWPVFSLIACALALFLAGCIVGGILKRHVRRPAVALLVAAVALAAASVIRWRAGAGAPFELALLALAMGVQGETIATFGDTSIQTIVVTNTMVKFGDALAGRYLSGWFGRRPDDAAPSPGDLLLPGCAWLGYALAAGMGALAAGTRFPLLAPAALLALVACDLRATGRPAPSPATGVTPPARK